MTDWMPEWLRLALKVSAKLAFLGTVIFLLVTSYYYYKASKFDLDKVAEEQLQNILLDHTGKALLGAYDKQSQLITKEDLPQHLIDALIAREDKNFETHCGVDFVGLVRAAARNMKDMSFTQGASTLTMQLARNTYDELKEKSLNRKFIEIALTMRIETRYTKPEIMAYYLNRIYFGSGCYGIEQASLKYFKKPTRELDISESATLVGIIRGPHIFSPLNDIKAAEQQRNQVLDRLVIVGKLSAAKAQSIKSKPLNLPQLVTTAKKPAHTANGYAMKALDRHLHGILAGKDIRSAGLTITSTLDLDLLYECENDIKSIVSSSNSPNLQAACIIIDHASGAIRCSIGGTDYKTSQFDRALDSKIDLGNAFSPFIYAAALERGKLPIKGKPLQTSKQLESADMIRIAKRFGLEDNFNQSEIFYGSGTTSPLRLATAFSVLSNNGKRPHTYFVKSIVKRDGSSLFFNSTKGTQAIEEGSALETIQLLKNAKGTVLYTTDSFGGRALWSMASHKEMTAVLWLGFDKAKPVPNKSKLLKQMENLTYKWVN
ncbi:transglycosylase domain-containing protein [Rubritalea sp.]|uniref:transglycosylase domain-containing protein n=1 Tax=Rubritalea sp. TaxID=2109375 RepID=UPI003242F26D